MSLLDTSDADARRETLKSRFETVRANTLKLAAPLSVEDQCVQSMPDVSPTKWHLGHTTWFWETFVLGPAQKNYAPFDERYGFLYNSYYEQVGQRHPRPERGMLTRPSLDEVRAFRAHADQAMADFFASASAERFTEFADVIALGLAHEEQHQELLLMDIKHVLSRSPLKPAGYTSRADQIPPGQAGRVTWLAFEPGLTRVGHEGAGFHFDCEGPRHRVWIRPFEIADRPVTNGEYQAFIADGGYDNATLWLSDGWAWVQKTGARAPLYWSEGRQFTLHGEQEIDPDEPVCHLTSYEADAYAEWAGARLPREAEWEAAAESFDADKGDYAQPGLSAHPQRIGAGEGLRGLSGGVWEWTMSAFSPYPGFTPLPGAAGEYNGKFMSGQSVMRGGCAATPSGHARRTYRNFFYPAMAWQFGGLRLARDI